MVAGHCSGTLGLSPNCRFAPSFSFAYGDHKGCHISKSGRAVSHSMADRVGPERATYVFQRWWLPTYSGQSMATLFEGLV